MLYDIGEKLPHIAKQADRKKELNRVCAAWAGRETTLQRQGLLGN